MPGFPGNVVAGEQFAVVESVEGKVWTEAFAVGYVSVADVEGDWEVFVVDGEVVEGYAEVDVAVVERDKEVVVVENDEFVAVVEQKLRSSRGLKIGEVSNFFVKNQIICKLEKTDNVCTVNWDSGVF